MKITGIYAARLIVGIAFIVLIAARANAQTASAPDRAFRKQAAEFVQDELRLYPERATAGRPSLSSRARCHAR